MKCKTCKGNRCTVPKSNIRLTLPEILAVADLETAESIETLEFIPVYRLGVWKLDIIVNEIRKEIGKL